MVTSQEEMLVVGYVTREMIIKALTKARTQMGLGDNCRVFFTNDIPVSRDAPLFDLRSLYGRCVGLTCRVRLSFFGFLTHALAVISWTRVLFKL